MMEVLEIKDVRAPLDFSSSQQSLVKFSVRLILTKHNLNKAK